MQEQEIGVVTHYFGHVSAGIVTLSDRLRIGEAIHIKGAHDDITMVVEQMQWEHKDVMEGLPGQSIGIRVPQKVHEHDRVFRVTD